MFRTVRYYFERNKRYYILIYTVVFVIISFFTLSWYLFSGRTLIYSGDGWRQYLLTLTYYSNYLQEIIKNILFNHVIRIPDWDFYIGEGSDILTVLHYYGIGDPFNLLSVLVPQKYMYIYYNIMSVFRLYAAGLTFSIMCFGLGKKDHFAILAGAYSYTFCDFALAMMARHVFFLNSMIYLPLLILGIEKIFMRKKPYLYTVMIMISTVSNFYFFYMLALTIFIYFTVRIYFVYGRNIKEIMWAVLRMALNTLVGLMMAGIILLPVLNIFLSDARVQRLPLHFLYPLSYYSQYVGAFVSGANSYSYQLSLGFTAPVMLAIFLLFRKRKENIQLKILFIICMVMTLIPAFGQIMNGFSYMINRWHWSFALLCAYILVIKWNGLMSLKKEEIMSLFLAIVIYYVFCLLLEYSRQAQVFAVISLMMMSLFVLAHNKKHIKKELLICLIIFVNIINNSYWRNAKTANNYVEDASETREIVDEFGKKESLAVKVVSGDMYTRYSGSTDDANAGALIGVSSTGYYWSLSNPFMNNYRVSMEMRESRTANYTGYDDRTNLLALAAVQYYSVPEGKKIPLPYGYTKVDEINVQEERTEQYLEDLKREQGKDPTEEQERIIRNASDEKYYIYKNDYKLPLGYCYDCYVTKETWTTLSAVQKQEMMMRAVYLSDASAYCKEDKTEIMDHDLPVTVQCNGDAISYDGNSFITTAAGATATIYFKGVADSETYLQIQGFDYHKTSSYELYFGDKSFDSLNLYNKTSYRLLNASDKASVMRNQLFWHAPNAVNLLITASNDIEKSLEYTTIDAGLSGGRDDFVINMGYSDEPITSITITFPSSGIYSMDSLKVKYVPMKHYPEQINRLKADCLEQIKFSTDTLQGKISLKRPKVLCVAIPYSAGWKAYVDGKEVPIHLANEHYIGIDLDVGDHTICLIYHTPYKYVGGVLSVLGFLIFGIQSWILKKKKFQH